MRKHHVSPRPSRFPIPSFHAVAVPALVASCFSLYSPLSVSQEKPPAQELLADADAVTVTATRISTRTNEITSDVTVIGREELDRGATTLKEVLRAVPGVEVLQSGGPGTSMTLNIRGTNTDHVLVLIDGVRMESATLGTTTLQNIPVDAIERIEVLRGPASSLYGSSALGGVVQIFTRSGRGNPGKNFSATYGSYNTARFTAGIGREEDGFRYALQVGATDTDGFNSTKNPRAASFRFDADGYRNTNVSGQVARTFRPGQEIGLRLYLSDGITRFDSTPVANDFRTYSTLASGSAYGQTNITERWKTRLTAATTMDDSTSYTSATVNSVIRTIHDQVSWQNDVKLPVGSAMVAVESVKQRINGTTAFPVRQRSINGLGLGYQASTGVHHFQVSGRSDRYDQFGTKHTGYGGYGFDITPALTLTAGTGTAFKAPTFNQLYFPGFGNPNLQPESARNSEVGLKFNGGGWQVSAIYFRNVVKNLIVNAGTPLAPQNIGSATLTGTSVTASTQLMDTDIAANLNWQDPRDASNNLLLPRRARQFMNITASRAMFGGKGGIEFQQSGSRYSDAANLVRMGGYGLLNAYFEKPIDREWVMFARADNLGGKTYELIRDFAVPGRSVFFGVRYQER